MECPSHDNPETSTRNQQTDEDTGQQHGPIPNQREQGCHQMTMVKKKRRKGLHLNPELHAGKTAPRV
uniref:Uncharacterized protein n=1 Tax=Brassica campestris TaxID=3711 RepID=A0A3P5YTG3_BRACM|nr:unnamed protein product [Brassica rapa]